MRLGVCHQVSLPGSWDDAIAAAGTLGVDGVELFIRESEVPAVLDAPEMAAGARAAAERAGLAISSLALIFLMRGEEKLADQATSRRAVDLASQAIRRTAEVGGDVVLIGGVPAAEDTTAMETYVASIQELAPLAANLGLQLGLESGLPAADVLAMLDWIGSPEVVGDYYDMGNLAGRGMDPAEEARLRAGRIVQVHAKGVRGVGLDAGTLDLGAVRDALRAGGFDGWLLLETAAGDDPLGNARRNLGILRQSFGLSV
jgi:sugar phosphate isomerase/epimerase